MNKCLSKDTIFQSMFTQKLDWITFGILFMNYFFGPTSPLPCVFFQIHDKLKVLCLLRCLSLIKCLLFELIYPSRDIRLEVCMLRRLWCKSGKSYSFYLIVLVVVLELFHNRVGEVRSLSTFKSFLWGFLFAAEVEGTFCALNKPF